MASHLRLKKHKLKSDKQVKRSLDPKKCFVPFILILIIGLTIISSLIQLGYDNYFPFSDDSEHLFRSFDLFDSIVAFSPNDIRSTLTRYSYYPPLVYWVSLFFYGLFGKSYQSALAVNWVFLIILVISVYRIGFRLADKKVGLLSAFLATMYPGVFGLFRTYMLDFALCSTVAMSTALLLETDSFENKGVTYLWGISLGVGLLTKGTFLIFLCAPTILITFASYRKIRLKNDKIQSLSRLLYLLIGPITVGMAIACIWYIPNFDNLHAGSELVAKEGPELTPYPVFSLHSITYYLRIFINSQASFVFFLYLVLGFVYVLKKSNNNRLFLAASFFAPISIFTLTQLKDPRFTMPVLVFTAVISAMPIKYINKNQNKTYFIYILISYCLINLLFISYYDPFGEIRIHSNLGPIKILSNTPNDFCGVHFKIDRKKKEEFNIISGALSNQSKLEKINRPKVGLIGKNAFPLNLEGLTLYTKLNNFDVRFISLAVSPEFFLHEIEALDFLLSAWDLNFTYGNFKEGLVSSGMIKSIGSKDTVYV